MSYNLTPEELHEMRDWYPKAEQLVRLGMLPLNQLPHIKRALVGIENDAYLPLIIRRPFYRFMDQVMELALGEPGIYRLIRNKVAANRNDSITNRYMPEGTTMDDETPYLGTRLFDEKVSDERLDELTAELIEGNAENKAKKRRVLDKAGANINNVLPLGQDSDYNVATSRNVPNRFRDDGDSLTHKGTRRMNRSRLLQKLKDRHESVEHDLNEEELSELSVELLARATDKSAKKTKSLNRKFKDEWYKGRPVSDTVSKLDKSQKQNHKFGAAYKEKLNATHSRRHDGVWVKNAVTEERDADERAGDREEREFKRKVAAYDKAAVDKAIASSRQKIGKKEGSAIHRLLRGRHESVEHEGVEQIDELKKSTYNSYLDRASDDVELNELSDDTLVSAANKRTKQAFDVAQGKMKSKLKSFDYFTKADKLRNHSNAYGGTKFSTQDASTLAKPKKVSEEVEHVEEGLFSLIRAKDIKLADIGKKKAEIPKPVAGRVKLGTRDGKTPRYTLMQDGSIKRQTNESLEIVEGNRANKAKKNEYSVERGQGQTGGEREDLDLKAGRYADNPWWNRGTDKRPLAPVRSVHGYNAVLKKHAVQSRLRGEEVEHELLNMNILDEDVNYRKTPEGMLQTLSNMVKIKKRHGGKVSVNDRKIASKARNELRRRKYYSAGQTLAASFDTAYLDLADLLAEQDVFLTDLQLDALENELTEEVLMELSPELKMRYAKKVEANFKEKGVRAKGRKQFDKVMKRLKTADNILKTEETIQESGLSKATRASYVKKALAQKSDADFNLGRLASKENENQDYPIHSDEKSQGGLGRMASVNKLLRVAEKRGKGISRAVESYAGDEDYPQGEEEAYKTATAKPKKIRPSKSTWYKNVDDAMDVKGKVDPKMNVRFAKEEFEKRFATTLELFEVAHISELDADMTKLFMSLVQSESKSDVEYQERVYDKIRAAKRDDSNLTPEQIRYRAEKVTRAAKTQAALDAAKEELPKTKIGSGWSKVKSDVE